MELIVSMTVMGLVLGLTVPLFRDQIKVFEKHAGRMDAQQNARFGISMIDRELRAAGVGVPDMQPLIVLAAPNAITFNGDLVSRDSLDVGSVYYDPDVSANEASPTGLHYRLSAQDIQTRRISSRQAHPLRPRPSRSGLPQIRILTPADCRRCSAE